MMGKILHKVQVLRSDLEQSIFKRIGDFLFHRIQAQVIDRLKLVYDLTGSKLGGVTDLRLFTQKNSIQEIHDVLQKASRLDF